MHDTAIQIIPSFKVGNATRVSVGNELLTGRQMFPSVSLPLFKFCLVSTFQATDTLVTFASRYIFVFVLFAEILENKLYASLASLASLNLF